MSAVQEPTHRHVVGVYDHDADLVLAITRFVSGALDEHGTAIVVATPAHRAAVESALRDAGYAPEALARVGSYVALDAADTLATFLDADGPDAERFRVLIEPLLRAKRGPGPVRVFGEMVALLWDRGEIDNVIALEALWNDMTDRYAFELLCAYAMSSIETRGDLGATKRVCDHHSDVVAFSDPAGTDALFAGEGGTARVDRMFVAAPAALRDVRRFVRESLAASLDPCTLDDAEIVASELATNAVRHARSPFRVAIAVSADVVHIGVRDASVVHPERRARGDVVVGGRGVELVAALSRAWGTCVETDGKTVWAELARVPEYSR